MYVCVFLIKTHAEPKFTTISVCRNDTPVGQFEFLFDTIRTRVRKAVECECRVEMCFLALPAHYMA